MKKVYFLISAASMFLFSTLLQARPDYDGPSSDGWTEILSNIGSAIKELFSFMF